ncbi:MAG: hypothetical protein KKB39_02305 [Nanoarchaeota archaeon]|nr:hypothetical protein [Nanoarchaeota archaeon]
MSNSTVVTATTTNVTSRIVNETFINTIISENIIGLKANMGAFSVLSVKQPNSLIILNSSDTLSMQQSRDYIENLGGKIRHIYPPHVLIGYLPQKISEEIVGQKNIVNIYHTEINSSKLEKYGKTTVYAADAWNKNFMSLGHPKKRPKLDPGPIINDALIPPDYEQARGNNSVHHSPPSDTETSLFMIRDVSVAIIFLESNGSIDTETEDWTPTEESNVINEIQAGLNWWINKESDADITFTYGHTSYGVPTSYEPINRTSYTGSADQELWITEAMNYLGYTSGGYFSRVRTYDDDIRGVLPLSLAANFLN